MYESIDNDRDWRRLSPLAKATFDTLKRQLGQYGINTFAIESLPRIVNCTATELEAALVELETPKPGRKLGWIRREDDVVWIVNGLRYEPTLFVDGPKPNANHRTSAVRHGQQLYTLTQLQIVADFMAYYELGEPSMNGRGDGIPDGGATPSPMPTPMVGGITESESESETENEIESESEARARAGAREPGSAPPSRSLGMTDLPADVIAFGAKFYGGANAERRREIAEQLLDLARGKRVRFKKAWVRAGSVDRLAAMCREVLQESIRDRNAAIAVLFTKLADSTDLSAADVAREREVRSVERRRSRRTSPRRATP
jgi:hypothetical protein